MSLLDHQNVRRAILSLRPGAAFALRGDTYDDLDWQDLVQVKPTLLEITAEIARLQALDDGDVTRLNAVKADTAVADLVVKVKTSTLAEMNLYVENQLNGTTVTQVRNQSQALFKRAFAVLMLLAKQLP